MKVYTVIPVKSNFGHDHLEQPVECYRTRRAAEARAKELGEKEIVSGQILSHRVGEVDLEDEGVSKADREALIKDFEAATAALFVKHPSLTSFSFLLYTDYFNDGSPLSYNQYPSQVNGEDGGTGPSDDGRAFVRSADDKWGRLEQVKPPGPLASFWSNDLRDLVGSYDEEQMKAMFGDHVEVVVTREGWSTTPFEDHE